MEYLQQKTNWQENTEIREIKETTNSLIEIIGRIVNNMGRLINR